MIPAVALTSSSLRARPAPSRQAAVPTARASRRVSQPEPGAGTRGEILWHQFPNTGGITGLALLSESHLTCHTFPEHRSICLNLFSCLPRPRWDFETRLREFLGADEVNVRAVTRDY